eukprot:gnl/MRDRNA2_/MRDRNA2_86680_c0_seq6.p1 gnl/MRDRNA2_/MRDRNA2_86680_c0~~gnl/MRDRNA2_/MRDRNA2_86680_c0_seq6.p1  ORF type:complete len:606 (+),score=92.13 gnl/MRDRNA2_/MRDRNA2_86680_c0_seq6:117-1934(+)
MANFQNVQDIMAVKQEIPEHIARDVEVMGNATCLGRKDIEKKVNNKVKDGQCSLSMAPRAPEEPPSVYQRPRRMSCGEIEVIVRQEACKFNTSPHTKPEQIQGQTSVSAHDDKVMPSASLSDRTSVRGNFSSSTIIMDPPGNESISNKSYRGSTFNSRVSPTDPSGNSSSGLNSDLSNLTREDVTANLRSTSKKWAVPSKTQDSQDSSPRGSPPVSSAGDPVSAETPPTTVSGYPQTQHSSAPRAPPMMTSQNLSSPEADSFSQRPPHKMNVTPPSANRPEDRSGPPRRHNQRTVCINADNIQNAMRAAVRVVNGAGTIAPPGDTPIMCGRRILQMIGKGAYGQVYESRNLATGEREVVKTVAKTPKAAFEAVILSQLPPHHHVIQLFAHESSRRTIYMFMQHGGNRNLFQIMHDLPGKRFLPAMAMEVSNHVVAGLIHLHDHGVCHLDIKPENIMHGSDELLRIADLGTARYIDTPVREPCGSFPFAAPEVIDTFKNRVQYNGELADVFSFGVLIFEIVFGLHSMYDELGWNHKGQRTLMSDTDRRAAEVRETLAGRTALCRRRWHQLEHDDFDEEILLNTLDVLMDPDPEGRVSLREAFWNLV